MWERASETVSLSPLPERLKEGPKLLSRIEELSQKTSAKLSESGFFLDTREISQAIFPSLESVLHNENISNNPIVFGTIERHIYELLERIAFIDSKTLAMYRTKKSYMEDLRYEDSLKGKTQQEIDTITLKELLQQWTDITLQPQMALLDRSFQRRALDYDYANFSGLQSSLGKIDQYLPNDASILDFVLERQSQWSNLAQQTWLKQDGMIYLIDTLNPPGKTWLKQMVKNGHITPSTRTKWYTDAMINGKSVDTVALLLSYQNIVWTFQSKETELSWIRDTVNSKKTGNTLPTVSPNFPEIAPSPIDSMDSLMKFAEKTESFEDFMKILVRIWVETVGIDFFLSGITGTDENGQVLRNQERGKEIVTGTAKTLLLALFGKCLIKLVMGTWTVGKVGGKRLFEMAKSLLGENHLYTKHLAKAV